MNIFSIFRRKRKEEQDFSSVKGEQDFSSVLNAARSEYWASNQRQLETYIPDLFNYKERYEFLVEKGLGCTTQAVTLKRTIDEIEESKRLSQKAGEINLFTRDIERYIRSANQYATIDIGGYLITYDDFDRVTDLFDLSAFPIRFYCGEATTVIKGSLCEIAAVLATYKKQELFNRIKEDGNCPVFVREIKSCNDIFTHCLISKSEKDRICKYIDRHHRILVPRRSFSAIKDLWISRDFNLDQMVKETGVKLSVVNRGFYITGTGLTSKDILIACSSKFMNLSDSDEVIQDVPRQGFLFQYTPYGVLVWFSFDKNSLREV